MGYPSNLGKVYAKKQSAWGVGVAANEFTDADLVQCKPVIPPRPQKSLTAEKFRGAWHAYPTKPGSKEGAEFTLEQDSPQGLDFSTTPDTPDAEASATGLFYESVLGRRTTCAKIATIASTGQAVDSIKFTNGDIAAADVGKCRVYNCANAPNGWTFGWHKTVTVAGDPDVIVPWSLPGVPVGSSAAYGAEVYCASVDAPEPFSVMIVVGDGSAFIYEDCVCPSIKKTVVSTELTKSSYAIKAGYWDITEDVGYAAYADEYPELPDAVAENGSQLVLADHASAILPQVEVEMTATFEPCKSIGASHGFAKYKVTGRSQMVTITELVESTEEPQEIGEVSDTGLQLDLCTTPGRALGIFGPRPQLRSAVEDSDASGLVTRKRIYDFTISDGETPTNQGTAVLTEFRLARA